MNTAKRLTLSVSLLTITGLLSLTACSDQDDKAGNSNTTDQLPTEISQTDWVDAKQSTKLDTGIEMKYVEMGNPDGAPLVLIHGMTDSSRGWSLMAPYLADSFHIYIPDLRGHGDTDKPDMKMYPTSLYASDIASFMDNLSIDKADIVGHSLGGTVAQALAVNYPEKVEQLVLESTFPVESGDSMMYETILEFGDNPPDDAFMNNWYSNPNPVDEEFLSYAMEESQALPAYNWQQIAKGSGSSDLIPFMDELDSPTLILWGSEDELAGKEQQDELEQLIADADLIEYEGNGHNIQWEIPEKMAQDVQDFLMD